MALNIISNFAANVAHRNLAMTDAQTSSSLAKLSSGKRVVSAKDDAASLAIGSRLRAEVSALKTASVNAGQAGSMLQIADGAMATVADILVRMKSLAVQSSSGQLSNSERAVLDAEYTALRSEIDRIADDTEFNGTLLIKGSASKILLDASNILSDGFTGVSFGSGAVDNATFRYSYSKTDEVLTVTKFGSTGTNVQATKYYGENNLTKVGFSSITFDSTAEDGAVFGFSYAEGTQSLLVTKYNDNFSVDNETVAVDLSPIFTPVTGDSTTATNLTGAETATVSVAQFGLTIVFDKDFSRTTDLTAPDTGGLILESGSGVNSLSDPTDGKDYLSLSGDLANTSRLRDDISAEALNKLIAAGILDAKTGTLSIKMETSDATTSQISAVAGIAFVSGAGVASSTDVGVKSLSMTSLSAVATNTTDIDIYVQLDDGSLELAISLDAFVVEAGTDSAAVADAGTIKILVDNKEITTTANALVYNDVSLSGAAEESVTIDLTSTIDAVAGAGNNLALGQTATIDVSNFGIKFTIDGNFDRTKNIITAVTTSTTFSGSDFTVDSDTFATINNTKLTVEVIEAIKALSGYDAASGTLSLEFVDETSNIVKFSKTAGINFGNGYDQKSDDIETGKGPLDSDATKIDLTVKTASGEDIVFASVFIAVVAGTALAKATFSLKLGEGMFANKVNSEGTTTNFTFKLGTGIEESDSVKLSIDSVKTAQLGLDVSSIDTETNANTAIGLVGTAIDRLNDARANVGAGQNRLDFAKANLASTIENAEAARSELLDLDIASEITVFTSKQVLLQAGVSMLAQANQIPQTLLRLLQ